MKIEEIVKKINGALVTGESQNSVSAFYVGDFLSRVMGKAPSDCCWFTVMNNPNVAGVACLADIKLIVLCEGVKVDATLLARCKDEGIAIAETELAVFDAVKAV